MSTPQLPKDLKADSVIYVPTRAIEIHYNRDNGESLVKSDTIFVVDESLPCIYFDKKHHKKTLFSVTKEQVVGSIDVPQFVLKVAHEYGIADLEVLLEALGVSPERASDILQFAKSRTLTPLGEDVFESPTFLSDVMAS